MVVAVILAVVLIWFFVTRVLGAEQSGSSPTSTSDSRIKQAYDWLVAKGANYGSTDAVDWDSVTTYAWGTYWNRIMESAAWEPDGTAVEADVATSKTFYSGTNNRTIKTGTAAAPIDFSQQSLVEWDDYKTGDETGEESTWTNTAGTATTGVWKDGRTGLYWSASQGSKTNIFPDTTHTTCNFFSTSPRGSYDGSDADCGVAINACGTLDLAAGGTSSTDWYLPSQKELLQSYIDGIYNQTNTTFVSTSGFWSSTENSSGATYAWRVVLSGGSAGTNAKTVSYDVRCVRRD